MSFNSIFIILTAVLAALSRSSQPSLVVSSFVIDTRTHRRDPVWGCKIAKQTNKSCRLSAPRTTKVYSEPPGLYIPGEGEELPLDGDDGDGTKPKYATTQVDYVAAARKRADEGRIKLREQEAAALAASEERRKKREADIAEGRVVTDFAPEDLSSYNAAADDMGFESSEGTDSEGGFEVISRERDGEGVDDKDETDGSGLIIPGEADDSGLVLF